MCDEGEEMPDLSKSDKTKTAGVHYAYPAPVHSNESANSTAPSEMSSVPLEDLMSKLKNL